MDNVSLRLNPLKRVKFISMDSALDLFMVEHPKSQSPQTGQVYFNGKPYFAMLTNEKGESQSPQTGQVYFNKFLIGGTNGKNKQSLNPLKRVKFISINLDIPMTKELLKKVSIPSNGSSLFQWKHIH